MTLPKTEPTQLRAGIHETLVKRLDWFHRHYDIVSHHAFGPNSERVYLGGKTKRVCRYCGSAAPQVKFKKLAHAIPDQVGNDWLFDHEECDDCNEHFAKRVEDDFAKWTLPWRSVGRIKGKKGIPSLKSNDKQFRINATTENQTDDAKRANGAQHHLKIHLGVNDARHELDKATETMKLTLERQPYTPMGVFKCLVKMAIAVMPPEEEQRCAHLKAWILLPDHSFESYRYKPLSIITFKGGTSLSKVYRVIDRFSEDIDLTYDIRKLIPDLIGEGGELPASRSQADKWTQAVRQRLPSNNSNSKDFLYQAMSVSLPQTTASDLAPPTFSLPG